MTIEEFILEVEKLGIKLTDQNLKDLEIYKNMLVEYNKKFNLTAITEEKDIYLKHFYDSLTITKVIDLNNNLKVLDIGTGAGFPGLVLKIIFPNLEMVLLDSNNKKITFLNEVIKELNLKNIICINDRAENLPNNYREYFDVVTSRAVAELRILAELSIPYLKINGLFIPMKANVEQELEQSKTTLKKLNSLVIKKEEFILPKEFANRTILVIQKKKESSNKYPRSYDIIKNKILK